MNVFVLNTGRCGSTTFVQACRHIVNYTAAHESRTARLGPDRLAYPPDHIEADNRLSWLLGRLERTYGDRALYVHLRRDPAATAASFVNRWGTGIIHAYRSAVLMGLRAGAADPRAVCLDYCDTVTANIELFLRDKSRVVPVALETVERDFPVFWDRIGARGDLAAALAEWRVPYNASRPPPARRRLARRAAGKLLRLGRKLPAFVRDA